jgi:hypothetical protein
MYELRDFVIYQIKHNQNLHCYIGSTSNYYGRIALHKCNSKTKETLLYKTIRENGGIQNYEFTILDKLNSISRREAETKENEYIMQYENEMKILNTYKCNLTPEQSKRFRSMEMGRTYYDKNKESILKKLKEKREHIETL